MCIKIKAIKTEISHVTCAWNFSEYERLFLCVIVTFNLFDPQPFGEGLVTMTVPQLRRGENSLSLWNILDINSPKPSAVNTFVGHSDVVLEFQWRSQVFDGKLVSLWD